MFLGGGGAGLTMSECCDEVRFNRNDYKTIKNVWFTLVC